MSEDLFLEKFFDGAEVELKPLGSVIVLEKGRQLNKELLLKEGPYPAYNGGVSYSGFTESYNYPENTIIISQGGASAGFVNFVETKFYANAHCYVVLPKAELVEKRYVYHFLKQNQKKLTEGQHGAGIPALKKSEILDILIPIPCPDDPEKSLRIQGEIVRLLDAFTELITELTTEFTSRKKQYNYYRDQLLTFEEGEVEWKEFGHVADIKTGQKPSEILGEETAFDYINAGTSRSGYTSGSNCEGDTVTTPSRGQGGIGYVGYQENPFWLGPLCYKMRSKDENTMINKFLYYFLQSKSELLLALKKEGGVPAVNKNDLERLQIPIPPILHQARIVAILDKFDTLTNSISEGLPREIELRQKQYAYYRDLLFNFPACPEASAGRPKPEVVA
jgi:type I restriction enzyme S subunit